MSADLLIAALTVDEERALDFEAADRAVSKLSDDDDVIDFERFSVEDPWEPEALERVRAVLRSDLRRLREAIESRVEFAEMSVRGATLYVTGGLSYGDGPTEIWDVIARLRAVDGVLAAAGFEGES